MIHKETSNLRLVLILRARSFKLLLVFFCRSRLCLIVDFYSLFDFLQARIHPEQSAASLSKENYGNLHKSIKEVRDVTSYIESLLVPVPVLLFLFFIFPGGEYAPFIANIEDEYL